MCKLIVFDWEGTVFNTTPSMTECILNTCRALALPAPDMARVQHIIGASMNKVARYLYPDISDQQIALFITTYRQHYLRIEQELSLFNGMRELLLALKQRGHLLAIATGKGRIGLDLSMARCKVGSLFNRTRCAEESRSKPHPLMLEQIAAELEIAPSEMMMVGDTSYDLEMARNMGCAAVGVAYGAHPAEALEAYPHRFIAPDVPSLAHYLLSDLLTR